MTKNVKGIATVVLVGAVVAGLYLHFNKSKISNAQTIVKLGGHTSVATLLTFDEAYVTAWAKALSKGSTTFQYQNKSYYTDGGKLVIA